MTDAPPRAVAREEFETIDIPVATVIAAEPSRQARTPESGPSIELDRVSRVGRSLRRITALHATETILGRRIPVVAGLAPRHLGPVGSDVPTPGPPDARRPVERAGRDGRVPDAGRLL